LPWLYARRDLRVLISARVMEEIVRWPSSGALRLSCPLRGSSSRGGAQGFRALRGALAAGQSVVIVRRPEGTARVVQAGHVGWRSERSWPWCPLRWAPRRSGGWSWDEFRDTETVRPVRGALGEPSTFARGADAAQQDAAAKDIESALRSVTWRWDEEAAR